MTDASDGCASSRHGNRCSAASHGGSQLQNRILHQVRRQYTNHCTVLYSCRSHLPEIGPLERLWLRLAVDQHRDPAAL